MSSFFPLPFITSQDEEVLNTNVALIEQPFELLAVHNKNCFIYESLPLAGPYVKALFKFLVNGNIFNNNTITIISPALGSLTLTAKDSPGLLEFKTTASPATAQEIAEDIARALNDSVAFNKIYVASAFTNPGEVTIEALTLGSIYSMTFDSLGSFVPLLNTQGTDRDRGQSLDNYGVYNDIFIGSGSFGGAIDKGAMRLVGSVEKNQNIKNKIEFDLSGILKNHIDSTAPDFENLVTKPLVPYVALWGELYSEGDNPRRKYLVGTTAVKWLLNAAQDIAGYDSSDLDNYIVTDGASDKCYLTNQPESKIVSPDTFELLSYLVKTDPSDIFRLIVITLTPLFIDQTEGPEQILRFYIAPTGAAYTFPIGGTYIPIDSIETTAGKKMRGYKINIRYGTTLAEISDPLNTAPLVISKQEYIFKEKCKGTTLVFLNRLGCFDTVLFSGEDEAGLDRSINTAVSSMPCSPVSSDFIRRVKSAEIDPTKTVNSGWIDKEHFTWLYELAASPEVYVLDPETSELTAVVITKMSYRENNTNNKYSIDATYINSANYNSITK